MSRSSGSQTSGNARNSTEEIEPYGEKCANLCRVYKLTMISRVSGYEQFEYLVFELLVDLITLLNEFVGLLLIILVSFGIELGVPSQ